MKSYNQKSFSLFFSISLVVLVVNFLFLGRKGVLNLHHADYSFFDSIFVIFFSLSLILTKMIDRSVREIKIEPTFLFLLALFFIVFLLGIPGYFYLDFQLVYLDKALKLFSIIVFIFCIQLMSRREFVILSYVFYALGFLAFCYFLFSSGKRVGIAGAGSITTARVFLYSLILYIIIDTTISKSVSYLKHVLLFCMVGSGLIATSTRATLILYILFLIYYLIFVYKGKNKFITYILLFFLSLYMIDFFLSSNIYYRLLVLSDDGGGESVSARFTYIEKAIELAGSYAYMGSGWGTYGYLSSGEVKFDYPHNLFVELLLESGWLSLLIVFFFICISLLSLLRMKFIFVVLFLIVFLNSMISGDAYDNRMIFFTPFLLARLDLISSQ
ncbi:O-antigen ligase family protein [Vibrio parahaemolyticus]|uniref:O-antigen ligase family protein n=2 Tax=Vibrio parahaemolyticus TaxID=670 RepID=UPI00084B264D|nr:O-antigen ligase family protein [Vibrio parahaemolyticus]EGR2692648.1 O-antigen ligase domain-containing protein [Vibrio parahaemolyticus]EGR2707650.1 O-antigen ligase domain-containing protein [Vibrio parahaemolyticus]ELA7889083.1 O-antigen ligase family protein [Vibrio parahaemolyticus]ELA9309738.1 O-antigen ligase family protein [Vibrio parahaemolyticus]ELI5410034.1 O-antigen ligase family protein [Vibrio parahaemolyticus]